MKTEDGTDTDGTSMTVVFDCERCGNHWERSFRRSDPDAEKAVFLAHENPELFRSTQDLAVFVCLLRDSIR